MAETLYRYGIKLKPKGNHNLQFRKPKLELGAVATDWSPAPEDPDEDLYEKFTILQTDFSVIQGEIQAKVWETDIQTATDTLYERMEEIYSYVDMTTGNITAEVADLTYTVHANFESLLAQVSDLVMTDEEITTRVADIEQKMGTGSNLLSNTFKMDMELPYSFASTEKVDTWDVVHDSSLPGSISYYAIVNQSSSTASSGSYWRHEFYWTYSQGVFDIDKLVDGETYTFSFYIATEYVGKLRVNFDDLVTYMTKTGYSRNDGTDTYGVYEEISCNGSISWTRVWVSFVWKSSYAYSTRIGVAYGYSDADDSSALRNYPIYICGLMLNKGSEPDVWDSGDYEYATMDFVYSEMEQLAGSISLSVNSSKNGSASIILTVDGEETGSGELLADGVRNAFANDTTAVIISGGTVTFNSNTFIVNSTNFSVTADGYITATAGKIATWNIGDNCLYSGPSSITSYIAGIYMGTDGFRSNTTTTTETHYGTQTTVDHCIALTEGEIIFYIPNIKTGEIYTDELESKINDSYVTREAIIVQARSSTCPIVLKGDVYTNSGKGSNNTGAVRTFSGTLRFYDYENKSCDLVFSNGMLTDYSGNITLYRSTMGTY